MGLLAQKRMLFVLIFLGCCCPSHAAEDLFRFTVVDYFGMKARMNDDMEPGYHPPQVVADLLDHPDEQTALAYLRWQRERLEKISRAQEMIDKVMAKYGDYGDMYKIQ